MGLLAFREKKVVAETSIQPAQVLICPECRLPITDKFGFRNLQGDRVHEDCEYVDRIGGPFSGLFRLAGLFQAG